MAIVSVWFSLGCMYLALSWWDNAVEGRRFSGCRLVSKVADCNRLQLSSVPQDLPTDIEELFLDFNIIKSLDKNSLSIYPGLKNLSLRSNRLELIHIEAFKGIINLDSLSLQDNNIATGYSLVSKAFMFTPSLKNLDLSKNGLNEAMVTILLKNLNSLEYLAVDNNIIMRLDDTVFTGVSNLKELSLERNYIYEIDSGTFERLVNLKTLNLAFNNLPCVIDFGLTQLRVLNLSFNHLEWFQSQEIDVEFQLELLDISHNQLLFFPLLPKWHHLHTLLLSDNRMRFYADIFDLESSYEDFLIMENNSTNITTVNLWEEEIISDLSTLKFLDISMNQFKYLPDGFIGKMTSLTSLKLDWNCLETFSVLPMEIASSLTELDLSNNEILELRVDNVSQNVLGLRYFNLSRNNLQKLPRHIFSSMSDIATIDLSHNRLNLCSGSDSDMDCVDIRHITSLRHLHLSGCEMELDMQGHFCGTALTYLDLSDNRVNCLHSLMDTSRTLRFLSLRNSLECNFSAEFSAYQSLKFLDLSGNNLTTFPNSLTGLSLQSLDLRKNNLSSLPFISSYHQILRSLNILYISDNPFDCCELSWLNILRRLSSINISDLSRVTCKFSHRRMLVRDISESVHHSCQWKTGGTLLYLLLTMPISLTLLMALLLLYLTFKETLLQVLKRRCRRSNSY
ncbi:transforming growth factor beta activator LRRC33 [Spea bombifrons]|uniref:transforming growth factor beta activator LRRC33 n=1 Tax=Spea bombifrons TaxID=233779 RepID=UPI0023494CBA|nr:transforming growth factor beta activator LRRC33 [Spea bombifrons]